MGAALNPAANKKLLFGAVISAALLLSAADPAWSQCTGQSASGLVCSNPNASQGQPSWSSLTLLFDRGLGATQGTILNRGASTWAATATPSLGLNGGTGGALTLNGSSTGSASISVPAAAGSTTFQIPSGNGSNGFVLTTDGSGHLTWTNNAAGGTVQSVGLSLPASLFAVSGSPVTLTGTLTGTLNTQAANNVWAGPTTGSASAPTFRSLVGADLPNPSSSSLGGIQSYAGVSSQWIRSISTSGVPASSQPAFSDISGALGPSQCPNPSASTIGCVESYVAVAHQWINTISTSGVPSSSQPGFPDISGNATLAQLPGIGNNTILSNIAGGTATPLANSLSAIIDSSIASTQGDILYRNASAWIALTPGTNGQVLTTGGAAANPAWATISGTGTVTNIATNNGITGGPITTTGTIGLATISTGNVLANVTGGSAVPTATTPSAVVDTIGSTEGSILYRGASVWSALTPGTNGQFLQTTGAGSTPQWATAPVTSFNSRTGAVVPTSGDYNAGQITYTPQGTGGVATTVKAELDRTIWANDYGAVCNGSTDDHGAFQNALNEGQTLGVPVKFIGSCAITTALSISTNSVDFSGDQLNSVILPPGGIDAIDIVVTSAVYLHDFAITYSSTPTATQAISVSAPATTVNNGSRFWNLTINSAFIGVNFLNADIWSLSNSIIASSGITNGSGVHVADSVNVDAGDNEIYGNIIQAGPGGIGILWTSSGGLRVEHNKILSNGAAVGIQFNLASGANTSDVIIANNSIEGFQTSGSVGIGFTRSGTTGSLSDVIIANNQIGGPMFCVLHPQMPMDRGQMP
jgi:hypothetical protein